MRELVATFSIVAFDPETNSLGVAVQSKFLAVGALVPYARAGVGAVATQALANVTYGPRARELLTQGKTASETIELLTEEDQQKAQRQVGIVDSRGQAAAFTGEDCHDWAGSLIGEHYAIQGNILAGRQVVEAIASAYEASDDDLAGRLLAALEAGQAAGGDPRGKQSAALLVVREGGGYGGGNDRLVDLRVDDHPEPIRELARIRDLHTLYFGETKPEDVVAVEGDVRKEVVALLQRFGYLEGREDSLGDLGAVAGARGEPLRAARLCGAADALREVTGYTMSVREAGVYEPYLSAARSELGETAFRAAWEEGRAMTEEQAIALALENEDNDANLEETESV